MVVNTPENADEILNIQDNNSMISIPVKNIFYIKASGNYVEIIEKNKLNGHLIRYTLKDLDGQFKDLFRCHKSYIVNINHITKITGNTKGYKIVFDELPGIVIPVSRTKGKKIMSLITTWYYIPDILSHILPVYNTKYNMNKMWVF